MIFFDTNFMVPTLVLGRWFIKRMAEESTDRRPRALFILFVSSLGNSGPDGSDGLPEDFGFRLFVMVNDIFNCVWFEPTRSYTEEVATSLTLLWRKTLGVS